jgi:hypothetical protein
LLGRGSGHGGAGVGHGAKGCCPETGCKDRLWGLTRRARWRDPTPNPHAPSRSKLGIPSRPGPSLRVSALGRQRAWRKRRAGAAVLGTGSWSLMLLGPKGGSSTMLYTHALRHGSIGLRSLGALV